MDQLQTLLPRPRKIAIWGHYHGGNQGDECTVAALIQNVRARLPDAELVGFSLNPADTRERHGIPAFPIRRAAGFAKADRPLGDRSKPNRGARRGWRARRRRILDEVPILRAVVRTGRRTLRALAGAALEPAFLYASYQRLRDCDVMVVAGSGGFFDGWNGPWHHPFWHLKWSCLARLCGTAYVPLSVGAGPLRSPVSRIFVRTALASARYRSFRDRSSAELVAEIGVSGTNPVYPDMAFTLDLESPASGSRDRSDLPPGTVVGLNALPHFDDRYLPTGDRPLFEAYLEKLARFTEYLIRNGNTVLLVYSQLRVDWKVSDDLQELLKQSPDLDLAGRLIDRPIRDFEDLVSRISVCDFMVSARYHCVILPWLLGIPVVGHAYHQKTWDLMEDMGQSRYCLDIDRFEVEELVGAFEAIRDEGDAVRAHLAEQVAARRTALAQQYDRLFGARPTACAADAISR